MIRDKLARFIWNAPGIGIATGVWLYGLTLPILMHAIGYAHHKSLLYTIAEIPIALALSLLLLCLVMLTSIYTFKAIYTIAGKAAGFIRAIFNRQKCLPR